MKIIVTGGAGFIGSHLVDAYVDLGHEVVVIDNLSTGRAEFVNNKALLIEADITNQEMMQSILSAQRPDVINHHAAHIQVGHSVDDPQFDAKNNILGTLNIMEAAKNLSVKKVIFAATGGAMYGNKPTPFDESMKEEPLSPYGISKRAAELYLNYYHDLYGIPYLSLRYSNVYGPRQNAHGESGVVAIFSEMIMAGKTPVINGDGTHTRDYVYVSDVVKANVLALTTDFVGELNIGTNTEISTNEVFDRITAVLGKKIERIYGPKRPGEQITSSLNCDKAKKNLGWEPQVSFTAGIQKVADWYRNQ